MVQAYPSYFNRIQAGAAQLCYLATPFIVKVIFLITFMCLRRVNSFYATVESSAMLCITIQWNVM